MTTEHPRQHPAPVGQGAAPAAPAQGWHRSSRPPSSRVAPASWRARSFHDVRLGCRRCGRAPTASAPAAWLHAGHGRHGNGTAAGAGPGGLHLAARQRTVGVRSAHWPPAVEARSAPSACSRRRDPQHADPHPGVGLGRAALRDYVGKSVQRGQPLFAVYSPDLARHRATTWSRCGQRNSPTTPTRISRAGANATRRVARSQRLERHRGQIASWRTPVPTRTVRSLAVRRRRAGEDAFAGQYVTPDDVAQARRPHLDLGGGAGVQYEAARLHRRHRRGQFPYGQAGRAAKIDFIYPALTEPGAPSSETLDSRDASSSPIPM